MAWEKKAPQRKEIRSLDKTVPSIFRKKTCTTQPNAFEYIESIMHHEGISFLKLVRASPSLPSLLTYQQHSGCPTVTMY